MCVVSMVIDASRQQLPPIQTWPLPVAQDMSEVIGKLAEIDKKLGTKDCYDPKKDAYIKELEDRIAKLEGKRKKSRSAK